MSPSLFSFSLLLISIIAILLNFHSLLTTLLNLEVMILGLVVIIILSSSLLSPSEILSTFIILTFGACGASVGLACLVIMTRSYGNDHLSSLTMNKF